MNKYFGKIYATMGLGLLISTLTAGLMATYFSSLYMGLSSMAVFIISLIEIGFVIYVNHLTMKNSVWSTVCFFIFAVLNGLTLATVALVYGLTDIIQALLVTTIVFFVMATYGLFTKRDLSKFAKMGMMVLIGIIVVSLLNIFIKSSGLSLIISMISVVIFAGLVASHNQRIKLDYQRNRVGIGNIVSHALRLYLDFINLFLDIIRLTNRFK